MKLQYKLKENYILKLWKDVDIENPNYDNNINMFLVYDHRQFYIKREGFKPIDIYNYLTAITDYEKDNVIDYSDYHIFTVFAYIHSGVSLSLQHQGYKFDTSSTGFILIKKDLLQQGAGNIEKDLNKEEATKFAQSLINEWNIYLYGDVYGFTLIEQNKCKHCGHIEEEELDSCGGFYKTTHIDLIEEILNHIGKEYYQKHIQADVHETALMLLS